jgi:hypothetical protein
LKIGLCLNRVLRIRPLAVILGRHTTPKKQQINRKMRRLFIKQLAKKALSTFNKLKWKLKLKFSKTMFVSFGENCLTDNILERHKLKLITTPFSHGRSNIEYIIQMELDNYKNFLNLDLIQYETLNDKKIPRLKAYDIIHNDYNELHKNGFEFTHHDVIASETMRLKFKQRVDELQKYKKTKQIIIIYHHRTNPNTDSERLFDDLLKIKQIYTYGQNHSEIVFFTQIIINDPNLRKMVYEIKNGIHYFEFHTLKEWAGDDQDIFWARCDEDLITKMISQIKLLKKTHRLHNF